MNELLSVSSSLQKSVEQHFCNNMMGIEQLDKHNLLIDTEMVVASLITDPNCVIFVKIPPDTSGADTDNLGVYVVPQ